MRRDVVCEEVGRGGAQHMMIVGGVRSGSLMPFGEAARDVVRFGIGAKLCFELSRQREGKEEVEEECDEKARILSRQHPSR